MDIFFAFATLTYAASWIAAGYILWNLNKIWEQKMEEAVRKQDDRLRKRFGSAANGVKTAEETGTDSETSGTSRKTRPRAGQSFRR